MICKVCKQNRNAFTSYKKEDMCCNCAREFHKADILNDGESVTHPSDLKEWTPSDMSELFWLHFRQYLEDHDPKHLAPMRMVYLWANHDNHALSNSIYNVLQLHKISLR